MYWLMPLPSLKELRKPPLFPAELSAEVEEENGAASLHLSTCFFLSLAFIL